MRVSVLMRISSFRRRGATERRPDDPVPRHGTAAHQRTEPGHLWCRVGAGAPLDRPDAQRNARQGGRIPEGTSPCRPYGNGWIGTFGSAATVDCQRPTRAPGPAPLVGSGPERVRRRASVTAPSAAPSARQASKVSSSAARAAASTASIRRESEPYPRDARGLAARPVRVQPVAVRRGGEPDAAGQQAAQSGDIGLHGPGRVGRHLVHPHRVRQASDVDGAPQVRRERGEQPPLAGRPDPHRTAVAFHQQRPEDAERCHSRPRPRPDTAEALLTCDLLVT